MISVIRGDGEGKTEFVLTKASEKEGKKYYIATMRVKSDDDRTKVENQRKKREGFDFVTIEQDVAIVKAIDKIKWMESLLGSADDRRVALIENLQTLALNEMFLDDGEVVGHKDVENTVLFGIAFLKEFFDDIIIVTKDCDVNSVDWPMSTGKEGKAEYIEAMKELNAAVNNFADEIFEAPFV